MRGIQWLYCSEEEVALRVLGPGRLRDWRNSVSILERKGLPRIDPQHDARYWPAVLAFFDRLNGLTSLEVPFVPDKPEKFKRQPLLGSSTPKRTVKPRTYLGVNERAGAPLFGRRK